MIQLVPGQHIHFVGIGGFGMSAIARLLLQQGYFVSGSDKQMNAFTEALAQDGAQIYRGHDVAHIQGAELLIISSAVPSDNIEVLTASAQGIPVLKRSDFIPALMQGHRGVAVAGTHGKTTTTAMIVHILRENGLDPTYVVGGIMGNTGANADLGNGDLFVIEADEYDNMFHGLRPSIEVITSIEYDHPDFFVTPRQLTEAFSYFIGMLPADGLLVACVDDPTVQIFAYNRHIMNLPLATYGIRNKRAMWRAGNIRQQDDKTLFEVAYDRKLRGVVSMPLPGEHNVLNALAALIIADSQGVTFKDAARALATFESTGRRFEVRADVQGIAVVDDYAHHPTAIQMTIEAARARYPNREIWTVWQPHTFSRTRQLQGDFIRAFEAAHHVLVTDIYASREEPVPGFTGQVIASAIQHPHVMYTPQFSDAVQMLLSSVQPPAVILIMSAGDAPQIGIDYLAALQEQV